MTVRYIYNTSGQYVAFFDGKNVFSPDCTWIGFVHQANEVYSPDGTFMGYLANDDRIIRNRIDVPRLRQIRPLRPLRPLRPIRPLRRLRMPRLPYPYEDVFESA